MKTKYLPAVITFSNIQKYIVFSNGDFLGLYNNG